MGMGIITKQTSKRKTNLDACLNVQEKNPNEKVL
jgi:hypothetical protein